MQVEEVGLEGVLLLKPTCFADDRGFFMEMYHAQKYADLGISGFVQVNWSHSRKGTIRGLHYQVAPHEQGKLVWCVKGEVFDVAVDIRPKSSTFGKWIGIWLSSEQHNQLWVPAGFAHGLCATSDEVEFLYACTKIYHPESERTITFDDPELAIEWPVPVVSEKDRKGIRFSEV